VVVVDVVVLVVVVDDDDVVDDVELEVEVVSSVDAASSPRDTGSATSTDRVPHDATITRKLKTTTWKGCTPPRCQDSTTEWWRHFDQREATISAISSPASVGLFPTRTPAAVRASIFAAAVPLPPDTMAPAWPIFLPGGAVTPAM
jgi:hypothetical protein